jgi:hypothetical protein
LTEFRRVQVVPFLDRFFVIIRYPACGVCCLIGIPSYVDLRSTNSSNDHARSVMVRGHLIRHSAFAMSGWLASTLTHFSCSQRFTGVPMKSRLPSSTPQ